MITACEQVRLKNSLGFIFNDRFDTLHKIGYILNSIFT